MKKILFSISAAVLLSACSLFSISKGDVVSLTYNFDDGAVPPVYYSEEVLVITPDYEKRILQLEYEKKFPSRTEETPEEDFKGNGAVGGQFFDRFEQISDFFEEGDIQDFNEEILAEGGCTGGTGFLLKFQTADAESSVKEFDFSGHCLPNGGDSEIFDFLNNFYRDVLDLLTESVPV